jgi:hypothetical protein
LWQQGAKAGKTSSENPYGIGKKLRDYYAEIDSIAARGCL